MANEKMNIYQKLIEARHQFLEAGVEPSGKHIQLEFKYFELKDIVPVATRIFKNLGLVSLVSFNKEEATMTVVNCDSPEEQIVFTSPMKEISVIVSNTGKQVTNEIQTLGSMETYQRRYLYLMALDVVENDSIDPNTGNQSEKPAKTKKAKVVPDVDNTSTETSTNTEPVTPKPAIPLTKEERQEVKEKIVAENEMADTLQITALKKALKKLKEVDPSQETFIQSIVLKTDSFTKLTKKATETLILKVSEMIDELSVGGDE